MNYIRFENVGFRYGNEVVLRDFSLSVNSGSRLALKGESGTGKTTLLRLLLGFERPDSGTIYFDGDPISDDGFSKIRSTTAWLPQDLNIGDRTVEEVIGRPFEFNKNRAMSPSNDQVTAVLTDLGLSGKVLKKPLRDLSTGQRQRVGLGLCHMLDRPLLLLDEPTSALDEASKQKAIDLLFSDQNRTIISTTHDPYWIEQCDSVVELKSQKQS